MQPSSRTNSFSTTVVTCPSPSPLPFSPLHLCLSPVPPHHFALSLPTSPRLNQSVPHLIVYFTQILRGGNARMNARRPHVVSRPGRCKCTHHTPCDIGPHPQKSAIESSEPAMPRCHLFAVEGWMDVMRLMVLFCFCCFFLIAGMFHPCVPVHCLVAKFEEALHQRITCSST